MTPRTLTVVGWALAVLFPPGGFAAGVALSQRRPAHSAGILVLSVVMLSIGVLALYAA